MPQLVFPKGEGSIGKLEISGLTDDQPLPATGVIQVPAGARVSLTIDEPADLTALKQLEPDSLTVLRLDHPDFGDDDLADIAHLTALSRLILVNTAVSDEGMSHVVKIEGLSRLFLDGTAITDAAVWALEGSKLTRLSLNNTAIGDRALEAAGKISTLTHLMCANTRVTDEGLGYLRDLPNLALLDVCESDVNGRGLVDLPRSLALVVFCEGPKVSEEDLKRIRQIRPDLVLNGVRHWTPPSEPR